MNKEEKYEIFYGILILLLYLLIFFYFKECTFKETSYKEKTSFYLKNNYEIDGTKFTYKIRKDTVCI